MLEVLKFLAGKTSGAAALGMTAMVLVYMLCISTVVNSLLFCVCTIVFLCISSFIAQIFLAKYSNIKFDIDKKEKS